MEKPMDWRIIIFAGVADVLIGGGLVVAAFTDVFGPDLEILALVGSAVALAGVGIIVFGRRKLSQAESRRGDLN